MAHSKITVNALSYEDGRNIKRLTEVLIGQRNYGKEGRTGHADDAQTVNIGNE
jgi:hypothetical protein